MALSISDRQFKEGQTGQYSFSLVDENDAAILLADLATLTLKLYDVSTDGIINSRNAQNVLNANNVTVSSGGAVVWSIQHADNVIAGSPDRGTYETHIALFEWTWYGGAKYNSHELELQVLNLNKVP